MNTARSHTHTEYARDHNLWPPVSQLHEHRTRLPQQFHSGGTALHQKPHQKRKRKSYFALLNFLPGFPINNQNNLPLATILSIIKHPYNKNTNKYHATTSSMQWQLTGRHPSPSSPKEGAKPYPSHIHIWEILILLLVQPQSHSVILLSKD